MSEPKFPFWSNLYHLSLLPIDEVCFHHEPVLFFGTHQECEAEAKRFDRVREYCDCCLTIAPASIHSIVLEIEVVAG